MWIGYKLVSLALNICFQGKQLVLSMVVQYVAILSNPLIDVQPKSLSKGTHVYREERKHQVRSLTVDIGLCLSAT